MPEIRPFCGLRFNATRTGALDRVVTPPYDVISPEERRELARSPYSMVHLILPQGGEGRTPYEAAAARLAAWIETGVLERDGAPLYYLLEQSFRDPAGRERARRGFFAVTRLPEAGDRCILGHERTFPKPVEDRLALTRATCANLGPVFALYSDPEGVLAKFLDQMSTRPPDMTARTFEGTLNRVWRVAPDPAVAAFLKDKTLYIADGHHRFETARLYRDEMRAAGHTAAGGDTPCEFVLMGCVALEDAGLSVFPTHRVIARRDGFDAKVLLRALEPWFDSESVDVAALPERLASDPAACAIGMVSRDRAVALLRLRDIDRTALLGHDRGPAWRDLDVAVLHRGILERSLGLPPETEYGYEKEAAAAIRAVQEGRAEVAFLLRATRHDQIRACAEAGEAMPQKSTYFFPKLPSGAVIHRLI
ncbi:MAG: DUF1015 domain-containing protein [Candidatus Hydrogenedentes bacterium]|nr:DUF1015 domain-containing protein [Candidatus Hydrogenedentota bacterium]